SSALTTALTVNMDAATTSDLSIEGANTPTLGANVLVRGAGNIGRQLLVGGANGLTNQGTITADRSGLSLTILPDSFNNQGTLNATGGGILTINASNWQSSGTINANNAIVNFGGTFISTNLGTINNTNSTLNITGTLNNTGNTYTLPASAGAFTLNGGRILGGTLNVGAPGASLLFTSSGNNRLDGVLINGDLNLGAGQIARLQNGAQINGVVTLSGNDSILALDEASTLNTALTINLDAATTSDLSIEGDNAPTLGANVLVRGAGNIGRQLLVGGTNSLTNQGTIVADRTGQTLAVRASSFTNQGTARATNGATLSFFNLFNQTGGSLDNVGSTITSQNALQINGGTLSGYGDINAAITNNATLRPELGGTGLRVTGAVSLLSSSNLVFQLGGLTQGSQYGFLNVTGIVNLGGNLAVTLLGSFLPANNDNFTVLSSTAVLNGAFLNVASGGTLFTSDKSGAFTVTYGGGNSVLLSNFQPVSRSARMPLNFGSVTENTPAIIADSPAAAVPQRPVVAQGRGFGNRGALTPKSDEGGDVPATNVASAAREHAMGPAPARINLQNSDEVQELLNDAEPSADGKVFVKTRRASRTAGRHDDANSTPGDTGASRNARAGEIGHRRDDILNSRATPGGGGRALVVRQLEH
ncbi:MAG: beta strand repeat-containing protein, partial [Chthoniobacterales bacterium]